MVRRLALFRCASVACIPIFAWAPPAMVAGVFLVLAYASLHVRRIPSAHRRGEGRQPFRQRPVRDRLTAVHGAAIAVGAMLALFTMPSPPNVAFVCVVVRLLIGSRIGWRPLVIEPLPARARP